MGRLLLIEQVSENGERNSVMQLVSYRIPGLMDESWRAGVEEEGRMVDVTVLWHDWYFRTRIEKI